MIYSREISALYDRVPIYAKRPDVDFYVAEARASGGPVLEIGCGTGRVLIPTARAGLQIDGLDASSEMLGVCRSNLGKEPAPISERVTLHQGDAREFDLGKTFSTVTAPFRVMQHQITIDDQLRLLDSVKRHLVPGGKFVFDVFNPSFRALVSADGVEREDTPATPLPEGRTFRRASRVNHVRFVDQVSEVELIYYVTEGPNEPEKRFAEAFEMRWFLPNELQHLLSRAGFRIAALYGDFDRSPLRDDSKEIIVVAEIGSDRGL